MALVGDIHLDLAGRGSAKALFRAALGLQLGHFRFLSLWTARHALWALIARPAIRWSGGLYRRDSAKATLIPAWAGDNRMPRSKRGSCALGRAPRQAAQTPPSGRSAAHRRTLRAGAPSASPAWSRVARHRPAR